MMRRVRIRLHMLLVGSLVSGCVLASDQDATRTDTELGKVPSTTELLVQMDMSQRREGTDPQLGEGEEWFHSACSQCHDTERATSKRKSPDEWLATVHRMAAKEGANIPESKLVPIATYLASLNPIETNEAPAAVTPTIGEVVAASSVSLNGTVSLLWRNGDTQVENQGFFPDVWVGADWRPQNNPFSVQVMACTTCHDDGSGGMNVELVEGSFRADLIHLMTGHSLDERESDLKLEAKAGRFIVPFGAYSGMTHPGVYRTLTNPLMYNMGRRVGYYEPVLPMPYSDEGVDLTLVVPLPVGFLVQLDSYAVNGLQEFGFTPSRSWSDNNSNTSLGGRATLGSSWLRIGGSFATGELQATGSPEANYYLAGGDVSLHFRDFIRGYYEYARREEDTTPTLESRFSGHVVEIEGMIWPKPKITLLARYDTIKNPEAYGGASFERFTWGPNVILPGGSLLILNHEHWILDAPLKYEDIIGFRWLVTF